MNISFYFLFALVCCAIGVWAEQTFDPRAAENQTLSKLLSDDTYNRRFRPFGKNSSALWGGPVKLRVQVYQYNVQLTVRQRWWDDRLSYNSYGGKIKYIRAPPCQIWKPDLFFANEIEAEEHEIFAPNELLRIYPDGEVLFSKRVTLRLSCSMNFRNFPFDFQRCKIIIPSYGYTMDDVTIIWENTEPIQMSKSLQLSQFSLENYLPGYCDAKTATGTYGCIKAKFLFKRSYSNYQIQVYIPISMLVILSWLTFWIDREVIIARVLMALMTLLTMATQVAHLNTSVPSVNYTKALDIWTGVCLTFSFFAICELIVVHHLNKRRKAGKTLDVNSEDDKTNDFKSTKTQSCFNIWRSISTPDGLDIVVRVVYPILFILFNIIYWPTYALAESGAPGEFAESMAKYQEYHRSH
ncbi:hypothetical protein CHUAL_010994 [Chamberlinius hualienensis]